MACSILNMNMTLPSIRTIPCDSDSSPISSDSHSFISRKEELADVPFIPPRLTFPLASPSDLKETSYVRRESNCSTSSAPSLTHSDSPSPSPPPTRPSSPDSFFLVPCDVQMANAVVMISDFPTKNGEECASSPPSPVLRPCKPSEARATLLIGPAISAHARRRTARMHPYRIVLDRRL